MSPPHLTPSGKLAIILYVVGQTGSSYWLLQLFVCDIYALAISQSVSEFGEKVAKGFPFGTARGTCNLYGVEVRPRNTD